MKKIINTTLTLMTALIALALISTLIQQPITLEPTITGHSVYDTENTKTYNTQSHETQTYNQKQPTTQTHQTQNTKTSYTTISNDCELESDNHLDCQVCFEYTLHDIDLTDGLRYKETTIEDISDQACLKTTENPSNKEVTNKIQSFLNNKASDYKR